jgi:hypothetical protein
MTTKIVLTNEVVDTEEKTRKDFLKSLSKSDLEKELKRREEASSQKEAARKAAKDIETLKKQPPCPIVGQAYRGTLTHVEVLSIRSSGHNGWNEAITLKACPKVVSYFGSIVDENKRELLSAVNAMIKIWVSHQLQQPECIIDFVSKSINENSSKNWEENKNVAECKEYKDILEAFGVLRLIEVLTPEQLKECENSWNGSDLVKKALKNPKELKRLKRLAEPDPKYSDRNYYGY